MKLTRDDLNLLRDEAAKEVFQYQADACLPGTFKALTVSDRIALAWFESAIQVLNKKGLLVGNIDDFKVELDHPDSTTPTDGYHSEVDMTEK